MAGGREKLKATRKRGRPKRTGEMTTTRQSRRRAEAKKLPDSESVAEEAAMTEPKPVTRQRQRRRRKRTKADADTNQDPVASTSKGGTEAPSTSGENDSGGVKRRRRQRVVKGTAKIKPTVKDLSVTLGLEKPRPRLSKAQKSQCDDDELQEERYNEEVHNLSKLEEVIRLSQLQDLDSDDDDDESFNGDDNVGMELSDDEEFKVRGHETRCPKPLPKRERRGGQQCLRRMNRNVQVSQEEVKEMCLIIKSSMRKSLTSGNTDVTLTADDYDLLESDFEDNNHQDQKAELVPYKPYDANSIPNQEGGTSSSLIVYRSLQTNLGLEDQWLSNNLVKPDVDMSERDYVLRLCNRQLHKNGLDKQLYYEHLSWVSVAVSSGQGVNMTNDGVLAWLPKFQNKFKIKYPLLNQDGTPGSGTDLDILLRTATLKVNNKLSNILKALLSTRLALRDLIEHVSKVYYDKRAICTDFEFVHENLNMRNVRFDESSVWGLKPIRLALEPPYFKTEDGLMAYPMTPDADLRVRSYGPCFFKTDKQKWTTKDLQQLKSCIKEALHSKQLCALTDRYEVLMTDCLRQYEEDMAQEGRFDAAPAEPFKRRRGRPKKSELEYSSKYGIIHPVVAVLPGGITIRSEVSPRLLAEWRTTEEKSIKGRTYEELIFMENERIDWDAVANKMIVKSRKHRTAEDCELAWRHEVHPKVNDKRWGIEESRRLKDIYARQNNNWISVAEELNVPTELAKKPGRTPYQCFFRVRNRLDQPKKLAWNDELDNQVLDNLKEYPGNWRLVAASIPDQAATKRQVIERYKKTINPVLRNGAFTRVEDCLLILTIEKLKPFLAREGHFGCLLAYLPWRCETTWRDRANNLFSDWIVPWTLEEDQMLLKLAKTMNRNWQKISEEFTSFKNRKGCLTRYKILKRRLKDARFNNSLEAYHEAYAMTRYNVFQYKHLKEILELLTKVQATQLPPEHRHFVGLLRDKEPSEVRLQHMLLTFDRNILDSAIKSLTRYVFTRDNYWKNWISKHGKRKRTFDRRTFHPDNPQSVASALHIRGLELKPKKDIPNISDFENEIYKFYARFKRTKALKQDADRPYIPDPKTLAEWSAVNRLISTPVEELENVPLKRKWKTLKPFIHADRNIARRNRISKLKKLVGRPAHKKLKQQRKNPVVQRKNAQPNKRGRKRKTTDGAEGASFGGVTNDEGYILIPPEPDMKKTMKRGRPRKLANDDCDPEFVMPSLRKDQSFKAAASDPDRRRSSRMPKKKIEDVTCNDDHDEEDEVAID